MKKYSMKRKLTFVLAFALMISPLSGAKCGNQKPKGGNCRPKCPPPVSQQPAKPCQKITTTTIVRKNKGPRRMMPIVPGHFHVHFERGDIFQTSNRLERVRYPYPVITR